MTYKMKSYYRSFLNLDKLQINIFVQTCSLLLNKNLHIAVYFKEIIHLLQTLIIFNIINYCKCKQQNNIN